MIDNRRVAFSGQVCDVDVRLLRTPVEYGRPAPLLGEHTDSVLARFLPAGADD